ncbi:MAG: sigma-70 family RNA polymerase sigma factor [Deltaproteobacteria bacterium]|nr:sigma-70 family RNA polymerase sigma factor [Deltaproteobacteria bacterium]
MSDQQQELLLLRAVTHRKAGAWLRFYRRYDRLIIACVRKVLHRYTATTTPEDLEDIVNTVCLDLVRDDYKKLKAYNPDRGYKVSSWVGLIATNTAHDALRRRAPVHLSLDDPDHSIPEAPDPAPSPMDTAVKHEQLNAMNVAIAGLSPGEQIFVHYYYGEGLEPTEIAEILGINVNTVYSRKNKVRANLSKLLIARGTSRDPL